MRYFRGPCASVITPSSGSKLANPKPITSPPRDPFNSAVFMMHEFSIQLVHHCGPRVRISLQKSHLTPIHHTSNLAISLKHDSFICDTYPITCLSTSRTRFGAQIAKPIHYQNETHRTRNPEGGENRDVEDKGRFERTRVPHYILIHSNDLSTNLGKVRHCVFLITM